MMALFGVIEFQTNMVTAFNCVSKWVKVILLSINVFSICCGDGEFLSAFLKVIVMISFYQPFERLLPQRYLFITCFTDCWTSRNSAYDV